MKHKTKKKTTLVVIVSFESNLTRDFDSQNIKSYRKYMKKRCHPTNIHVHVEFKHKKHAFVATQRLFVS